MAKKSDQQNATDPQELADSMQGWTPHVWPDTGAHMSARPDWKTKPDVYELPVITPSNQRILYATGFSSRFLGWAFIAPGGDFYGAQKQLRELVQAEWNSWKDKETPEPVPELDPKAWPEFRRAKLEPAIERQEYLSWIVRGVSGWESISEAIAATIEKEIRDWCWGLADDFERFFKIVPRLEPPDPEHTESDADGKPGDAFNRSVWFGGSDHCSVLRLAISSLPHQKCDLDGIGADLADSFDRWWTDLVTAVDEFMEKRLPTKTRPAGDTDD